MPITHLFAMQVRRTRRRVQQRGIAQQGVTTWSAAAGSGQQSFFNRPEIAYLCAPGTRRRRALSWIAFKGKSILLLGQQLSDWQSLGNKHRTRDLLTDPKIPPLTAMWRRGESVHPGMDFSQKKKGKINPGMMAANPDPQTPTNSDLSHLKFAHLQQDTSFF